MIHLLVHCSTIFTLPTSFTYKMGIRFLNNNLKIDFDFFFELTIALTTHACTMTGTSWIDTIGWKIFKQNQIFWNLIWKLKRKEKNWYKICLRSEQSCPLWPRSQWHSPSIQRPCPVQPGTWHSPAGISHSAPL